MELTAPDDWHHHLRDDAALETTVPFCARTFRRAICMPNLAPPVTTAALAVAYRERIMAQVPPCKRGKFEALMTLYLTDSTTREAIVEAKRCGVVYGCKLYPKGATTNSHGGVSDVANIREALDEMEAQGLLLLVHGEATGDVDVFHRERTFLEETLKPLVLARPGLKVVLEHCSTEEAAAFVLNGPPNLAASVTPQHIMFNRNAMLANGLRPHLYCMPILKTEADRAALAAAVTSGSTKFFLGTDSAPHELLSKHTACGCAGVFSAHAALELYATVFERAGALDKLEAFAAFNGPDFYGLPRNTTRVTLERTTWTTPKDYPFKGGRLVPILAGEDLAWKLRDDDAVPVPGSFCARCPPPPPSDSDPPPKKPKT